MAHSLCPWTPEADYAATDLIWKKSRGCTSCPRCCYSRQCLIRVHLYGSMFLIAALVMVIIMSLGFKTYQDSLAMKPTECTVVSAHYTAQELTCDTCEKKRGGCPISYNCLEVKVSYQAGDTTLNDIYLVQSFTSLFEGNQCLITDSKCQDHDPKEELTDFISKYGSPGSTFDCFYHQNNVHEVMLEEYFITTATWGFLGGGTSCLIAGLAFICLATFVCGCKNIWDCKPSEEINEEVRKRHGQQQPHQSQQGQWFQPASGATQGEMNHLGSGMEPSSGFSIANYNSGFNYQQQPPPPSYTEATDKA